jgi:ElaB/YqjD/DUF883 family membrane-anchored ribosome-binding protein
MVEEPDQLRDDIELTRAQLARNVDRLADKTSPSRTAQRSWASAKGKVRGLSDRVMGTAHSSGGTVRDAADSTVGTVRDRAGDVADTVRDQASQAAERVRETPAAVSRQTQGNPLAAGLIAFGAGMLAASLLPTTALEKRAGQQVHDHADDLAEPVRQPLTESAQNLREDLGATAREAVAAVRDTTQNAAQTTTQAAKESAQGAAAQAGDTARSGIS